MFSNLPFIIILSNISTFIPFLGGILLLKKKPLNKDVKILIFLFIIAALTEVIFHLHLILGYPNTWISHFYTPIEYSLWLIILSYWQHNVQTSKIIRWSIPVYLILYITFELIGLESIDAETINYISRPISLIVLSLVAAYTLLGLAFSSQFRLIRFYRFWILLAIFIYYMGSIIIYAFSFTQNRETLATLAELHSGLNILHNLLFMIGIICIWKFGTGSNGEDFEQLEDKN